MTGRPTPPSSVWVYGANGGGAYYLWGLFASFGGKILADDGKCAATAGGVADALKWLAGHEGGRRATSTRTTATPRPT